MSLRQTTSRCLVLAGLSALAVFAADVRTGPATRLALPASQASTSDSMSSASAGRAALASPVGAATLAAALPIDQAGSDPLTVEPRVPRAAGTPCVVELARDAHFTRVEDAVGHPYSPPAACPGP